jgi:hypothetical protein
MNMLTQDTHVHVHKLTHKDPEAHTLTHQMNNKDYFTFREFAALKVVSATLQGQTSTSGLFFSQ